jgi:hypothetical protein
MCRAYLHAGLSNRSLSAIVLVMPDAIVRLCRRRLSFVQDAWYCCFIRPRQNLMLDPSLVSVGLLAGNQARCGRGLQKRGR